VFSTSCSPADWNGGDPTAGSGAAFDLRSNSLRPAGWTSADAAGLPIFAGLARLDEVRSGRIDHPIRITAQRTDRSYLWPARHQAGAANDASLPPMGAWFRMKAGFDTSRYRPETRVILDAFKRHGLIVADNGSNWFFTGAADEGWDTAVLDELKSIPAGAFEAVDVASLMVHPDSGQIRGVSPATSQPPPAAAPAVTSTSPAASPTSTTAPPTTRTTNVSTTDRVTTTDDVTEGDRVAAARTDNNDDAGAPTWPLYAAGAAVLMTLVFGARRLRARRSAS